MTEERRLGRLRISHQMLTEMVRRYLIIQLYDDLYPIDMRDVVVTGTAQDRDQLAQGTLELFVQSPNLHLVDLFAPVPIVQAVLQEDNA